MTKSLDFIKFNRTVNSVDNPGPPAHNPRMSYEHIAYEANQGVLTITLDRPEQLNAFTNTMQNELIDAFDRADADDGIRAIVVTGRGRGFCAGADLSGGATTFDATARGRSTDISEYRDGGGQVTLRIFELKKPIIDAINGPAVGVGITMTLAMDVRLASENARMGFVFSRRGIVPEACSSWFLPRIVGISQAMEWVSTGRVADNTAPVSVALCRQLMWRGLVADHPMKAHMADSRGILLMGQSADVREGVASFLEKRKPDFKMSVANELPDLFPFYSTPVFE